MNGPSTCSIRDQLAADCSSPALPMAVRSVGGYEIDWDRKLGEGAFGSVFHGLHADTGLEVAVKIVSSDRVKEDELESISKAQSACVVQLIEVLKRDDLTYIVMELCQTDLNAFLTSYGKLNEPNLAVLIRCLAEGYLVLHRHGILHRDIKPQNILLRMDSSQQLAGNCVVNGSIGLNLPKRSCEEQQPTILAAKFADFGCSRVKGRSAEEGPANCAGTFLYMAPEVGANLVNSNRYDEAVDMWSVGVVLYQAMTGCMPFNEQQLCRLFLRAVDQNYSSYAPPQIEDDQNCETAIRFGRSCDCNKHYRDVIGQLLQLDPSVRLNPVQFHSLAAHDQPANFIRCLNEGSCSDTQTTNASLGSKKLTSSVSALRRTASGVFSRLRNVVSGCRS